MTEYSFTTEYKITPVMPVRQELPDEKTDRSEHRRLGKKYRKRPKETGYRKNKFDFFG